MWHWLNQFMRKIYAICVEWTKFSKVENRSLSMRLLHAAEMIKLRLCIKFVRDDCTLENECSCHFKLFQKLRFYHHSRCHFETLCDCDDDSIVREVNVLKHIQSKMRLVWAVHQNMLDDLMTSFVVTSKTIRAQYISWVQINI